MTIQITLPGVRLVPVATGAWGVAKDGEAGPVLKNKWRALNSPLASAATAVRNYISL